MRDGGYKTLNFRVIAEHLNTSKANIHHHFGNKEGLANEVINDYSSKMLGEFKRLAAECDSDLFLFIKEVEDLFWSACLKKGHCVMCLCEQVARVVQVPNTTKFRTHTGWEPKISYEKTIRDLLDFWRKQVAKNNGKYLTR